MKRPKPIEIDGRTGEGGGQVVRIAIALASVVGTPVRITNVRGNREGRRGGGLKAQHVTALEWLAKATKAEVEGLSVGSKTLEFRPTAGPGSLVERNIKIVASTAAASAMLIFQALLPFLLFAGNDNDKGSSGGGGGDPIKVEISGGTNVSFSLSYEYLDQVLLPALEHWFGIRVERQLVRRGWNTGPSSRGLVSFTIHPLQPGQTLKPAAAATTMTRLTAKDYEITDVDASIIAPGEMHDALRDALVRDLLAAFPDAKVNFPVVEESGHGSRRYVLLVARSSGAALRWGRDELFAGKATTSAGSAAARTAALCSGMSRRVVRELAREVGRRRRRRRGVVDEFLQDQLVVFQALAEGRTSFPRSDVVDDEGGAGSDDDGDVLPAATGNSVTAGLDEALEHLALDDEGRTARKDRMLEPFGEGSMHTKTARWVTAELLPQVQWFNRGNICEGCSMKVRGVEEGPAG